MRRAMVLAALGSLLLAAPLRAAEIPVDQLQFPVPRDNRVRVDFPVGEFRVEPITGDRIVLELRARCRGSESRCEERASRVRIESDDFGGDLHLEVKGYRKTNARFTLVGVLRVPSNVDLEVNMGVGQIEIEGMHGNLDVDLGVGEARIETSERAVHRVEVATGIGDASLRTRSGHVSRRMFISCTANWDDGPGRSAVSLNVGVGEARVRLD